MSLRGRKGEPPAGRPAHVSVFERLRADFGIGPGRERRGCEPDSRARRALAPGWAPAQTGLSSDAVDRRSCLAATWGVVLVAITPGGRPIARRC
jgi:hypothetical protein